MQEVGASEGWREGYGRDDGRDQGRDEKPKMPLYKGFQRVDRRDEAFFEKRCFFCYRQSLFCIRWKPCVDKLEKTFPLWECHIPTLGIERSHRGNICFALSANSMHIVPLTPCVHDPVGKYLILHKNGNTINHYLPFFSFKVSRRVWNSQEWYTIKLSFTNPWL